MCTTCLCVDVHEDHLPLVGLTQIYRNGWLQVDRCAITFCPELNRGHGAPSVVGPLAHSWATGVALKS